MVFEEEKKMENKKEFFDLYCNLFKQEWKNKQVWELIKEKEMSIAPHFIGKFYNDANIKLMVIGRCLNGWETEFQNCKTLNNTVNSILDQTPKFDDAVNIEGIPYFDEKGIEKRYYYSKSSFWRLIKKLSVAYNGESEWNEKFVWSNLYKISPRKGGNPSWRFNKKLIPTYVEIIKKEIEMCKPSHIVFITDINYLKPYEKENMRFDEKLNIREINDPDFKYIVAKGEYCGAKIIVCKRPERRPTDIMVEEIQKVFKNM